MDKQKMAFLLAVGAFLLATVAIAIDQSENLTHTFTYINQTDVRVVGAANNGTDTSCMNNMNVCSFNVSEDAAPFDVYINFTGVTKFDELELNHQYNSTTGISQHVLQTQIFCYDDNNWLSVEEFTQEDFFMYRPRTFFDSSHFIQNGLVQVRYHHPNSGNNNHRLWIDLTRLVIMNDHISHT